MVERAMDNVWIPIGGGHRKEIDADGVPEHSERDDKKRKCRATPRRFKKEKAGNEAGDKKNKTGADSAAFLSNANGKIGESENKALTKVTGPTEVHQPCIALCGGVLERDFEKICEHFRERNHEEQEQKWKEGSANEGSSEKPFATCQQKANEGKNGSRKIIIQRKRLQRKVNNGADRQNEQAQNRQARDNRERPSRRR